MSKTVLVLPDQHAHPDFNNDRADWAGQLLADLKPDVLVNIGDAADMASLSNFDKGKASFISANYQKDIEAHLDFQERLFDPIRKSKRKQPYKVFLEGNHCVPENTDVLTLESGWVRIPDVTTDNHVMTMDGWQKPTEVFGLDYDGDLYKIGNRSVVSYVTAGHRVYYYTTSGNLSVSTAENLPFSCDLPVSTVVGSGVSMTDDQIRFNAVAMTDSHHKPDGKGLVFYQSGKKAETIERIIKDTGTLYRKVERDRTTTHICGKKLKSVQTSYEFHMLRPSWCVTDNKGIPDWAFDLTQNQFEVLLETLVFCDGTKPTGYVNSNVFYGRKSICEDLQAVCVTKGYRATLSEYRKDQWRVNIVKTHKCRAGKTNLGNYKGKVFCLSVPASNFLMRQDYKPVFTGNCHRLSKVLEYEPHLAGDRYGISFSNLDLDRHYNEVVRYDGSTPGIFNLDGVLFAHYCISGVMGRPIGGINHASSLINKNHCSTVVGHSHTFDFSVQSSADGKTLMGLVCGVYQDYTNGWAGGTGNLWQRGLAILRNFEEGRWDLEWVSMKRMKELYG